MSNIAVQTLIGNQSDLYDMLIHKIKFEIRCCAPGIFKSFNSEKQTVTVQLVTKEKIVIDGNLESKKIPLLVDVPIFMPRAGDFVITMPIRENDECLVCFADTCIDDWFQRGGEENEQLSGRRHDLSDAFALCGVWNQTRVITNYSTDSVVIRNETNQDSIELKNGEININSFSTVNVNANSQINIDSSGIMNVKSTGVMDIESESLMNISSTGVMAISSDAIIDVDSKATLNLNSTGAVNVTGSTVTVTGGRVNLGSPDGNGIARIGDNVVVGGATGTITGGSSKVFAG